MSEISLTKESGRRIETAKIRQGQTETDKQTEFCLKILPDGLTVQVPDCLTDQVPGCKKDSNTDKNTTLQTMGQK